MVRALFKLKVNVNVSVQPSVVRSDGLSYGERGEIESSYDQNTFILNVIEVVENNSPCYLVKSDTDLDLPSLARALYWADQMVCNSGGLFAPSAEYFNCFLYSTFKSFL